jgi:hypothetical protein
MEMMNLTISAKRHLGKKSAKVSTPHAYVEKCCLQIFISLPSTDTFFHGNRRLQKN